ncbi:MAG: aminotransferase class I/II-fold pyridoxal phosphate-dependent enzyme [Vicinamibacterales bacterium]
MKAIILAAGLGRRMQPLTDHVHKSLLPVGGTTILGRIVDSLLGIDVRDILVVTGYRAEDIRAFLAANYPDLTFQFVHNARFDETNNIVSLAMALDQMDLDDDVLLIESDVLFEHRALQALTGHSRNVALVDHYRSGMDGTVVAVEQGVITGVYPPHIQGENFVYRDKFKTLNIYRFTREFCRRTFQPLLNCYASLIDEHCYYELVLGMLVNMQRERICAEVVDGSAWTEVDDPNDLQVARFAFDPERRPDVLDRCKGGLWNFDVLDFSYLRNMYFPSDAMLASMREALPDLVRNYGSSQEVLDEKLAALLLCRPDRVHLLNGASQAYPWLAGVLGATNPLLPTPTFGEYPRWFSGAATYTDAPGVDLHAVARLVGAHDVAVFVNPNSPTGTTLPTAWLHELASRHPQTRFLIDESFIDFSDEESMLHRLERAPLQNVLVLASLSKSLGVPGVRLGYLYTCNPAWHAATAAHLPIWNSSALAEYVLELCLKYRGERTESLQKTAADRAAFAAELSLRPWVRAVAPSGANFLMVALADTGTSRAEALARTLLVRSRIYIKDVSARFQPPMPALRLAVRIPAENQRLLKALDAAVEGLDA